MKRVKVGKNDEIIFNDGKYYLREYNQFTQAYSVIDGVDKGDVIEFYNGLSYMRIPKSKLEIMFLS